MLAGWFRTFFIRQRGSGSGAQHKNSTRLSQLNPQNCEDPRYTINVVVAHNSSEEILLTSNQTLVELVEKIQKEFGQLKLEYKKLLKKAEKLEKENRYLKKKVISHESKCQRLEEGNRRLKTENHELKMKLGMTSANSSMPPSTDIFIIPKQRSLREKSDRNVGGQIGHKGSGLEMRENPDEVLACDVRVCTKCKADIRDANITKMTKHQVFDLFDGKIKVTEYRRVKKKCPNCGYKNAGELPEFAKARVQYGPEIIAKGQFLYNKQYVPAVRAAETLNNFFGANISPATIVNHARELSLMLEKKFVPKVKRILANSTLLHVDETMLNVNAKNFYVHSASNNIATYHAVYDTRGDAAVKDIGILPKFKGTLIHDAYSLYFKYGSLHQLCVAHLLRELRAVTDYFEEVDPQREEKCWSEELTELFQKYVHATNQGQIIREAKSELLTLLGSLKINDPPGKLGKKHQALRRRIERRAEDYTRFVRDFSVPATNNFAEREIRMMKVKMKVSGMAKTVAGARAFTNMRSFISTLQKHGVSILPAIADVFAGKVWVPAV